MSYGLPKSVDIDGQEFAIRYDYRVIGTYLGHKITVFRRGDNYEGLDTFWDYLYQHSVDDSVMLEAADGQTTISYEAYYTSASQDMEKVEGSVNYWGEIEVSFVPIDAQVKP